LLTLSFESFILVHLGERVILKSKFILLMRMELKNFVGFVIINIVANVSWWKESVFTFSHLGV
jgi:hypothetical protein